MSSPGANNVLFLPGNIDVSETLPREAFAFTWGTQGGQQ